MPLHPFYSLNKLCLLNIFQDHTESTRRKVILRMSWVFMKLIIRLTSYLLLGVCCNFVQFDIVLLRHHPFSLQSTWLAWWCGPGGKAAWPGQYKHSVRNYPPHRPSVSQKPWIASQQQVSFKLVTNILKWKSLQMLQFLQFKTRFIYEMSVCEV